MREASQALPGILKYCLLTVSFTFISGCSSIFGPQVPEQAATPTAAVVPTFTPTSTAADVPAAAPAETPAAAQADTASEASVDEEATQAADEVESTSEENASEGTGASETVDEAADETVDEPADEPADETADETDAVKTLGSLLESASPEAEDDEPEDEPASDDTASSDPTADEETSDETSDGAAQTDAPVADAPESTEAARTGPIAIVTGELVNVRSGPSTAYELVGGAASAEEFPITGRNEQGDWWQVCCFNGDAPGWLYGPLVEVQNADAVAVAADIPPLPTPSPTAVPVAEAPTEAPAEEAPVEEAAVAEAANESAEAAPAQPAVAPEYSATLGNFDPNAEFHIVHYHVRGFNENNGGIFNNGGQHMIFITVLDENGNGIDGAVVKDTLADSFSITTGNKGPGKTEFEMFWEPYKLTVASIPSGPVTSQISNQMNTAKPHIPDIIGKMGPPDHEYAICPTPDDRCEPPFFHAHWSYEITFQKVR